MKGTVIVDSDDAADPDTSPPAKLPRIRYTSPSDSEDSSLEEAKPNLIELLTKFKAKSVEGTVVLDSDDATSTGDDVKPNISGSLLLFKGKPVNERLVVQTDDEMADTSLDTETETETETEKETEENSDVKPIIVDLTALERFRAKSCDDVIEID